MPRLFLFSRCFSVKSFFKVLVQPEDAIIISASHVDSEDAALFKKTVDSVLNMIAKKGFEQDLVDSVMASLSMDMKLSGEGQDVGVGIIENLAYYCASDGDEFSFMDYVDALGQLDDWNAKGMYKDAVSAWLVKKPVTALVTTYPQPGLQEELDAAEAERLAAVKAAMSPEEIKAVVDATNAPEEEDDSAKYVAQLQAVSVSSLPEEIRSYEISDETGEDGVRRLTAQAGVDGVGQTAIFLDASGLPQEDIHWFALYTALLGQMDTDAHTQEELAALTTRYLYNGQIRLSLVDRYGTDEFKPFLRAGWIAADEDLAAGYDLVKEILYRTSFDDAETLLGLIQKNKANLKSGINNNPYSAMLYRAFGNDSPLYAYYNYYSFLDLYAFLEEVEKTMESDPGAVAEKLTEIQSYFRNRTNAVAVYAGSAQGIETNAGLVDAFMADLEAEPVESVKYDFPKCADSEALIVDGSVQFNGVVADFDALGKEYTADLNALSGLVTDMYLYPMLRDQYGVYGVLHAYSDDAGTYVVSYRDPNVTETFDVFEKMPGFVKDLELDQETLDGYILSSYAEYAKPDGELSGAVNALLAVLSQEPADLEVQYMRQLKTITPEKVREYADMYENMLQKGIRFTAGSASAVNANADLYDKILNPFGAVDTSEVEFSDAAEGSEHYDAVRFVFEERLMAPAGETEFGVDTEATVGELAGALNVIIEGDMAAQEEALQLFASYGIVPGDWKITDPLTGKDAQRFLENFSQAVGAAYTADKNAADAVLTRGELAQVIMAYCNYLEEQFAE